MDLFTQKFDFVIKHTSGVTNKVADASSRKPSFLTVLKSNITAFDHLPTCYENDPDFHTIWLKCSSNSPPKDYHLLDGFLFCGNRLCIPQGSLREAIIMEANSNGLTAHLGRDKHMSL